MRHAVLGLQSCRPIALRVRSRAGGASVTCEPWPLLAQPRQHVAYLVVVKARHLWPVAERLRGARGECRSSKLARSRAKGDGILL